MMPPDRGLDLPAETTEKVDSRYQKELYIAAFTLVGLALHLVLRFGLQLEAYQDWPLYAVLLVGGVPLIWDLLKQMVKRRFGADWLAGIAIVTSILLGEYLAGSIVVLMLSGGEALEGYAAGRASSVLRALAERMPSVAHRKEGGVPVDIAIDEVDVGDVLIILPHETCPVDGEVVEGHGVMDESYLTGEPYTMSKAPGSEVLSGAVNGETALTIRAGRKAEDSRYARIMEVMRESQQSRPRIRKMADQLGAWYTPLAVFIGLAAWFISGEPVRFLAVVVVATPCPLLIGIPVAIIGAISLSAKRGIIIKDPRVLEQSDRCRTLIVDKTGTLTSGRPVLTDIAAGAGFTQDEIVALMASAERYSKHPLARAVVAAAKKRGIPLEPVSEISERPGQGLTGKVGGRTIHITSRNKLFAAGHLAIDEIPPIEAGLECVVLVDDVYAATCRFHDEPRAEGRAFIAHLAPHHAIDRILLVSGDRQSEVEYLAEKVGIELVYAEQSPEDKVAIVRRENERGPTLFVGDGINDAPAMTMATAIIDDPAGYGRVIRDAHGQFQC
ncbi:MAG: heavy metal translocating P-type ATPase, partial [Bradymonadaceae bacterium]